MTHALPQLDRLFLTDGGLETDMIYNRGVELPFFASVMLLRTPEGREALSEYFRSYLDLARRLGTGFELVSASWRASPDWAPQFGLSYEELDALNRKSIELLIELRNEYRDVPTVVSGCIGPRGDGYDPGRVMSAEEARDYHRRQLSTLACAGADLIDALTMTNIPEAVGIALAARSLDVPVAISFTVETDGRLPTGDTLDQAIAAVDKATGGYPAFYMVNCAHPDHFWGALFNGDAAILRLRGIRANASRCSHAELDAMTELDDGNPEELGQLYRQIREALPGISLLGGCCGTDLRHIAAIADACLQERPAMTSAA
jgi:homocysteine S-methyltransferase